MSITISDIARHCTSNVGGSYRVSVALVEDIDTFPAFVDQATYAYLTQLTFKSGKDWAVFYPILGSINHNEEHADDSQSGKTPQSITMRFASDSAQLASYFNYMKRKKFIIQLHDRNDYNKLIGTVDQKLSFKWQYDSGSQSSDLKSYTIEFFGETLEKAPFYP